MKQCVTCLQWKNEEEFNYRYKALGIRHPACRDCHKTFRKAWYEKNKEGHLANVTARKHVCATLPEITFGITCLLIRVWNVAKLIQLCWNSTIEPARTKPSVKW